MSQMKLSILAARDPLADHHIAQDAPSDPEICCWFDQCN
jgi:hypothetical protein